MLLLFRQAPHIGAGYRVQPKPAVTRHAAEVFANTLRVILQAGRALVSADSAAMSPAYAAAIATVTPAIAASAIAHAQPTRVFGGATGRGTVDALAVAGPLNPRYSAAASADGEIDRPVEILYITRKRRSIR